MPFTLELVTKTGAVVAVVRFETRAAEHAPGDVETLNQSPALIAAGESWRLVKP